MRILTHQPFKSYSSQKSKHVIMVCEYLLSHKRLAQSEDLQILFYLKRNKIDKVCIQKKPENSKKEFSTFDEFANEFLDSAENKLIFSLNDIFQLIPISIPKPWGQEIWYSGIESRGVSRISTVGSAGSIPLSWIYALPSLFLGKKFAKKDPILIKILDPYPQEVIGDLYYELHQKKNEVYIVTDVTGPQGKIKIGINPEKLKLYSGDKKKYKKEFLKNILNYEKIRRQIDGLIHEGQNIPDILKEQEILLRKEMDSFCGYTDLKIGDVIHVPTFVPHALQHGVKVIEFQTPTYERLIISFAQKVLTQSHWDTKRAFDVIHLEPFQKQALKILSKTRNVLKELVCVFPDFKVHRWTLNAKAKCKIPKKSHYRILFVVSGEILMNGVKLLTEMSILIPQNGDFIVSSNENTVFILAEPK